LKGKPLIMAHDAKSYLQTFTTATNSLNTTATPLNTSSGSPNFGYRVSFQVPSYFYGTAGTGTTTFIPQLFRAPATSGPWTAFWQGDTQTVTTATQSYMATPLISLGANEPYLAAGINVTLGGTPSGLQIAYQVGLVTAKEDSA